MNKMQTKIFPFTVFTFSFCFAFLFSFTTHAQCPSGTMGITGAGCGCLSGCNLSSIGGPNCSPAVSGDCGNQLMSVSIPVPDGCVFTVTAVMAPRPSCSASGGDSGDQLKVDELSGIKASKTGTGNATLTDNFTLIGPGTIVVSGSANRADEIITYTTTATGPACVNCMSVLPIELLQFDAVVENNQAVACTWITESEQNSDYFTIEKSPDGIHFEYVGSFKGAGNSSSQNRYKLYDYNPYTEIISYYRLIQVDFNGKQTRSDLRSVHFEKSETLSVFPNPSTGLIQIAGKSELLQTLKIIDQTGRIVHDNESKNTSLNLITTELSQGVYTLSYQNKNGMQSERIVITR